MKSGIYAIKNLENNKMYIGASMNIPQRIHDHFEKLSSGHHHNKNMVNDYNPDKFIGEVIAICPQKELIDKENFYIWFYDSINNGYNMAWVNEHGTNIHIDKTKIKISKSNLKLNDNIDRFKLTSMVDGSEHIFDSLFIATNYLMDNNYANGKPHHIRMRLSQALRGVKVNNGKCGNGSIRRTIYKHKFQIQ